MALLSLLSAQRGGRCLYVTSDPYQAESGEQHREATFKKKATYLKYSLSGRSINEGVQMVLNLQKVFSALKSSLTSQRLDKKLNFEESVVENRALKRGQKHYRRFI